MRKLKKALASLAIAGMVLSMAPASIFAADSNRIEGKDRYDTAIKIAEKAYSEATTAVVAAGNPNNLVDALAVAPLAAQEKAPIYLTNVKDNVDVEKELLDSLDKLGVEKVFAVGAAGKDKATVDALEKAGYEVEVLAGEGRIQTAEAINAKLVDPKGTIVVGLLGEADAMSVASFAAVNKYQIVIADRDGVTTAKDVDYIVGGEARVKNIDGATRLSGNDRYETNKDVVSKLDFSYNTVYVANGRTLADALVASVLAAQTNSPILLANDRDNSVEAASVVNEKLTADSKVIALGGTAAVSNTALNKVAYKAPAKLEVESVSAINAKQIVVKFNKAVEKSTLIEGSAGTGPDTLVDGVIEITRIPEGTDTDKNVDADTAWAKLNSARTELTITAAGSEYFEGKYAIYIDNTVRSADEYLDAYSGSFVAAEDKTAPTVKNVTYNSATNKIRVTLSEPVKAYPSITIDDGAPVLPTANDTEDEFTVENPAALGKTVTVTVSGAIDYNDNRLETTSKSLKIDYNESELQLTSAKQKSSNKVELVFDKTLALAGDEAVKVAEIEANLTVLRGGIAQDFSAAFDANDKTNRTVILTFSNGTAPDYDIYPAGKDTATLSLVFGEEAITDIYGNTNKEFTKTVTMTKDKTGPVVSSIRLSNDKKAIEVRFNENVTEISSGLDNLTVRDDNVIVTAAAGSEGFRATAAEISATDKKLLTIPYQDGFDNNVVVPNGKYTVRIPKGTLKDDHGNSNNAIVTSVLNVTGSQSAANVTVDSIEDSERNVTLGANQYIVKFSGKVGNSALLPSSYTLKGQALPANTDLVFVDSDKKDVLITIPANTINYSDNAAPLRVVNVKDSNDNKVQIASFDVKVVDNVKPVLSSASLTGNTITLTFSENMDTGITNEKSLGALLADLEIKGNAVYLEDKDLASDDVVVAVDGKIVTITFTNTDATKNNWSTVRAASNITVKVVDDTLLKDANNNGAKTDVTVKVVKK